jgi:hypothetical protein
LREKHSLEVEEEVLKDEVNKALLKETKRKKNLPVVKVTKEEI